MKTQKSQAKPQSHQSSSLLSLPIETLKARKLELVQRQLGLRHKLRVHDSLKVPESHEDLAALTLARWELEDEHQAIEQLLAELRNANVTLKRESLAAESVDTRDLAARKAKRQAKGQ